MTSTVADLLDHAAAVIAEGEEPIMLDTPDGILNAVQLANDGYLSDEETASLAEALAKYPPIRIDFIDKAFPDLHIVGEKIVDGDDFSSYTPDEWMRSSTAESIIEDIASKLEDQLNADFQESPGKLYHATDSDNVEEIMRDGLKAQSRTRGLTNRSVGAAIFTTDSRDQVSDAYGDTVLEIDLAGMKRDGLQYAVAQEPAVHEAEAAGALAHALDVDDYSHDGSHDGADDPSTIILYVAVVPPKYLRVV